MFRWLGPLLLAAWLLPSPTNAFAETRALLVGVSGYPSLPASRRLKGPANDVRLMRALLQHLGTPPEGIRVLADGVEGSAGLPTRKAILDALDALASSSQAGDRVVLYFSGHGSQQPQPARTPHAVAGAPEPDGLDEIFLPYDIGHWDGRQGTVRGAIVDDEFGRAILALRARGASVWAVFDTCHAGDMARAWAPPGSGIQLRQVPPSALGIPKPSRSDTTASGVYRSAAVQLPQQPGLTLFYAAQPDEPATEEPLPAWPTQSPQGARVTHGLFTHTLATALWQRPHASLAELAATVRAAYRTKPFPTPLFEGDLSAPAAFGLTATLTNRTPAVLKP